MRSYINDFNPIVQTYFKELKKYKPLSKDNEQDLLKKAKNSILAKNQVLTSNLKFVFQTAKKYRGYGVPMEDLIAEGNIGLTKAIERFDTNRDVKFISYAVWWINQTIQEFIKKKKNIDNIESEKVDTIKKNNSEDELEYDLIDDTDNKDEKEELKFDIIKKLVLKLNDREQYIINSYYGLNGEKEKTLDEIGKKLKISKERTRQIKEKSLRILRSELMLIDNFENIFN